MRAVPVTPRWRVKGECQSWMKCKTTAMHLFPTASLQWSHSRLNEPVHIRTSEAQVCFHLMTLSAVHAVQLHMIAALVHGELWKTQDRSLQGRAKVLSMYKTQCSDSTYWTFELCRMCHYVLMQLLYMLLTQCLNLRGTAVKEDWLFLGMLDPEDKTKHFSTTSVTTQPTAPWHVLHDSTNGMVLQEANSQLIPAPYARQLFNQWHSATSQIIIPAMVQHSATPQIIIPAMVQHSATSQIIIPVMLQHSATSQ